MYIDSESEDGEDMQEDDHENGDLEFAESSGEENDENEEPVKPEDDEITTVQLLAARRDKLQHEKLRIGALCSSLLESPEKKVNILSY